MPMHSRCKRRSTRRRPDVRAVATAFPVTASPVTAAAPLPSPLVHVEHVMGTVVSFDVRFAEESRRAPMRAAVADAVKWLHRVDAVFSTYRHDSQVSRLGRGELRLADCDGDVGEVLELCAQVSRESDGYFSSMYGGKLDPTGLVKGWAVQRASEQLSSAGSTNHLVNGGGDIQAVGGRAPGVPWQIGIAHPLTRGAFASVVWLSDGAVATSGMAERGAHVIDPFTGQPAIALASVTVVGRDLIRTDAYATAAIAMGGEAHRWLEGRAGYDAFAVGVDGLGWSTSGYCRVGSIPAS
jgi:thiamine biosynthesis lipoprotein